MRISVVWDDETHTILRYIYTEGWTWNDYEVATKQAYDMTQEANSSAIDVIADFSESTLIPKNLIANFQTSLNSPQAISFGVTVLITRNLLMLRMIEVYRKLNRRGSNRVRTAQNLDEARAIIAQVRIKRISENDKSS